MSEASKSCSSTSTTSTRLSPTSAIHVFDDFDELAVVLPLIVFVDVDGGVHDAKSASIFYFSVYNTVPRASPENFISLS